MCIEKVCTGVSNNRIARKEGIYLDLFLVNVKQPITNLLFNRRQYKVKLILSCMMSKIDLKGGEVIVKVAAFHSKTEVDLETTNLANCFRK